MNENYKPEEWKDLDVEGCGYRYKISTYGRVYDKYNGKYVSPVLTGKPQYFYVNLQPITEEGVKGKRLLRRVHNLQCKIFKNNPDNLKLVDHIDRNKYNNCLDNLRWADSKTNTRNLDKNNKLVTGELVRDYCEKENLPYHTIHWLFTNKSFDSWEDTIYYFEHKYNKYLYKNYEYLTLDEVAEKIGLDSSETKELIKSFSVEEIIDKGYRYIIPNKPYAVSIEDGEVWIPSKKYLKDRYGIPSNVLKEWTGCTTLKSLLRQQFLKDKITFEGISLTWKEWSVKTGVKESTLRDRYSTKKWSIEKTLTTPPEKIKFYNFNGEKVTKKAVLEYFNIPPKSANSVHSKNKHLSLNELLETKYLVDLSTHHLSPWSYL